MLSDMKRILILSILSLLTLFGCKPGNTIKLPNNCKLVKPNAIIAVGQASQNQHVILFINHSQKKWLLDLIRGKNPGMSAGWASELAPNRASILGANLRKTLRFGCFINNKPESHCQALQIYRCQTQNPSWRNGGWIKENQRFTDINIALNQQRTRYGKDAKKTH